MEKLGSCGHILWKEKEIALGQSAARGSIWMEEARSRRPSYSQANCIRPIQLPKKYSKVQIYVFMYFYIWMEEALAKPSFLIPKLRFIASDQFEYKYFLL